MKELLVFKDQDNKVVTTIGDIECENVREINIIVGAHENPEDVAEQIWANYSPGTPSLLLH